MISRFTSGRIQTIVIGSFVTTSFISLLIWLRNRNKSKQRSVVSLKMIPALEKPSVHIKDPDKVESVINSMIQDGAEHLQVITDFDRTLSGYCMNGDIVDTTHQALDNSPVLPNGYRENANMIRDRYYPIEIDPNLTVDEKIPFMVEWWTKAHNLLVQASLTRSSLKTVVSESNIQLRKGCLNIFEDLHRHQVPLLIFSAGVGDIIVEVISQRGKLYENMKIVSNYMDFNGQIEESLDTYKQLYDIVLVSDETMDVPSAVLKKIL
ncbi:hypothetical protein LSH36_4g00030 [Paralvinella palmiformis]|uniref:5'-nucleotidase n=1 Tax=Paralvinella palmiformis TaxID=53620 RepID=A0AAD9KF11_9ANNE|nr:hypothetical protein LSH36_4g00030 [Paralvinella palmiformis]